MAIKKPHSDQLDLLAWADTRSQVKTCDSGIAISCKAETMSAGRVIDARHQFQQRTSNFIRSLVLGYYDHPTTGGRIINLSAYGRPVSVQVNRASDERAAHV